MQIYVKIFLGCDDMAFLIGVIILILFIIFVYFFIKLKIRSMLNKLGYSGVNLKEIINEARLEDQEVPKSLSSMDSIYLEQIKKDFIDININELKRQSEKVILDCFDAVSKKNSSKLDGKIKSFVDSMINDYEGKNVKFKEFKFHNTVVSKYKKEKGIATIYFASSFQYYLDVDGKSVKTQDRARVEFIYIYDTNEVDDSKKVLGIHCPNCGSPITSLGQKKCSYCGSVGLELISRVFTCNDVERY
jgi:hypothetical protein